ncbi:MAG: glycosyltransferase family 2 protein [Granulosicoccus sp.]|nr:glycosyltransferase family 2 protein [Granulosicoccus sp.]
MILSIVVPAHNEEGNIRPLTDALVRQLAHLSENWELIFVDDGSTDSTWQVIEHLAEQDQRVIGIQLSRNFGHQNALVAGLTHAQGEAIVSMDCDMQHPPSVVPELLAQWQRGYDIVKTVRKTSENTSRFKRLTSDWFYRLFTVLSGVEIESGASDFRLLDRRVLNEIIRLNENEMFLRGVVEWVGYRSSAVEYTVEERLSGESKYTVFRMFQFAWNGISSFSLVPLRAAVVIGLFTSFIAFSSAAYAILAKYFSGQVVPGWASTLVLISFLFGVIFVFLGILGEYVGRILVEVRARPRFLVSRTTAAGSETRSSMHMSTTEQSLNQSESSMEAGRASGAEKIAADRAAYGSVGSSSSERARSAIRSDMNAEELDP